MKRHEISLWLVAVGGSLVFVGILLLLVQLVMILAWQAAWIGLAGLLMLAVGMLLRGR